MPNSDTRSEFAGIAYATPDSESATEVTDFGGHSSEAWSPFHDDEWANITGTSSTLPAWNPSFVEVPRTLTEPNENLNPSVAPNSSYVQLSLPRFPENRIDEVAVYRITPREGGTPAITAPPNVHIGTDASYAWAIGSSKNGLSGALDTVCHRLFDLPFSEISVPRDSGLRKAIWINGLLNAHLSRFELDPENDLQVKRHLVELIVSDKALMSVDHGGLTAGLLNLKADMHTGRVPTSQAQSAGGLATLIVNRQLDLNEKVLDRLEQWADYFESIVKSGPLRSIDVHERIPTLVRTLEFFKRKTGQFSQVILAITDMARENPKLFDQVDSEMLIHGCEERLHSLLDHITAVLRKLDRVQKGHDRHKQAEGDKNVERHTVVIGLSAPPLIAEIACNVFLENVHWSHPWIVGGAFAFGIGVWLRTELPKWGRSVWLRWHERQSSPENHSVEPE